MSEICSTREEVRTSSTREEVRTSSTREEVKTSSTRDEVRTPYEVLVSKPLVKNFRGFAGKILLKLIL